jgi:serine/threonine-protein kinase RsbW
MKSLRLPATLENLDRVRTFVLDEAGTLGFPREMLFRIDLVLEELATNVVLYAYPDKPGDMEIRCDVVDGSTLYVELRDSGIAFDPLTRQGPDIEQGCNERGIGGLGIYLARRMVDGIGYRRENHTNILTVRFKLGQSSACTLPGQ